MLSFKKPPHNLSAASCRVLRTSVGDGENWLALHSQRCQESSGSLTPMLLSYFSNCFGDLNSLLEI